MLVDPFLVNCFCWGLLSQYPSITISHMHFYCSNTCIFFTFDFILNFEWIYIYIFFYYAVIISHKILVLFWKKNDCKVIYFYFLNFDKVIKFLKNKWLQGLYYVLAQLKIKDRGHSVLEGIILFTFVILNVFVNIYIVYNYFDIIIFLRIFSLFIYFLVCSFVL